MQPTQYFIWISLYKNEKKIKLEWRSDQIPTWEKVHREAHSTNRVPLASTSGYNLRREVLFRFPFVRNDTKMYGHLVCDMSWESHSLFQSLVPFLDALITHVVQSQRVLRFYQEMDQSLAASYGDNVHHCSRYHLWLHQSQYINGELYPLKKLSKSMTGRPQITDNKITWNVEEHRFENKLGSCWYLLYHKQSQVMFQLIYEMLSQSPFLSSPVFPLGNSSHCNINWKIRGIIYQQLYREITVAFHSINYRSNWALSPNALCTFKI